ncbi:MAG: hypothetical protein WCI51_07190 [Lentisphaerota bacterium]
METAPECFENLQFGKKPECPACEFSESCKLYFKTENKMERRCGHVSYEAIAYSKQVASKEEPEEVIEFVEPTAEPQHEIDENELKYSDEDFLKLMMFMLRIDDYSLGVVESVINGNLLTASDAARAFNVSRQAMHRKIVDSVRKHSELRSIFKINLSRCKKLRDENLNHGKRDKAASEKEQLELL